MIKSATRPVARLLKTCCARLTQPFQNHSLALAYRFNSGFYYPLSPWIIRVLPVVILPPSPHTPVQHLKSEGSPGYGAIHLATHQPNIPSRKIVKVTALSSSIKAHHFHEGRSLVYSVFTLAPTQRSQSENSPGYGVVPFHNIQVVR
jgi:hypothetical protein